MRVLVLPSFLFVLLGLVALVGIGGLKGPHGLTLAPLPLRAVMAEGSTEGGDFRLFYAQARALQQEGGTGKAAYDAAQLKKDPLLAPLPVAVQPSFYPPSFFLGLSHVAQLPFPEAFWLYQWGGVLALLIGLVMAFGVRWEMLLLGLGFGGVWRCLDFGQTSLFITAAVLMALGVLARYPMWSGFFLGLATVKPHLGLGFPLQLLWRQHWSVIFVALITTALLLAGAFVTFGPEIFTAYRDVLLNPVGRLGSFDFVSSDEMASVYAGLRKLGLPTLYAILGQGVVAAYALWRLYKICDHAQEPRTAFAAAITAGCLITPHLYSYDLALLVVPVLVLMERLQKLGWTAPALVLWPLVYGSSYFITSLSGLVAFPLAPLSVLVLHELFWHTERQVHVAG